MPRAPTNPVLRLVLAACLLPAVAGRGAAAERGGAVASGHRLATAAGLAVLRDGGNAVDAAVTTALALAVVYPEAGNLGGGGFAVVRMRGDDVKALDFRETAPAAARRGMYLDARGRPRPGASTIGPLAAGVPGSPSGLYELHRALGRLPWARVVAPAVLLSRDGFEVDAHLHERLAGEALRRLLGRFPESAAVWLPGGRPLAAGERLRLPALAATLERYAAHGPPAVTSGPAAEAVAAASRRQGGVLTAADLAAYRPVWRPPLRFAAFGWQFATMPLPSAGGIALGQTLAMLERLGWSALPRSGADRAHLLVEVFRRVFADRSLLGDPAASRATPADLLDPRWIAARAAGIDPARATPSAALAPWPGPAAAADLGGETTHLSAVDAEGNAVALTTTLNGLFGCGLFVPEIGFLNNEMDDFSTGGPALLSRGEPNGVAPGKRMLSSMTPTIAWRGDDKQGEPSGECRTAALAVRRPRLATGGAAADQQGEPRSATGGAAAELIALGARGSLRIPTHLAQVLLAVLVDGDALQPAIDRPRLHQQGLPDRLEAEPGALSPEAALELARRGHRIAIVTRPDDTARVTAVRRLAGGGFEAAVDPRGAAALGGQGVAGGEAGPR
jgi:gamma-glutamyltranspeptidase / glutathione hydrolase